jgi:hypothetical protein
LLFEAASFSFFRLANLKAVALFKQRAIQTTGMRSPGLMRYSGWRCLE